MGYYCLVGLLQFLVCILGMYCEILGLFLLIGVDLDNVYILDILNGNFKDWVVLCVKYY